MSRNHKLIFVGSATQQFYRGGGVDNGKDYSIDCKQNDVVFVTEEKKTELLGDHPEWFKKPEDVKVEPEKPPQLRQKPTALPETESEPKSDKPEPPPSVTRKEGEQPKKKRGMKELRKIAKKKNIKVPFGISIDDLEKLIEPKN